MLNTPTFINLIHDYLDFYIIFAVKLTNTANL